MKKIKFGPKTLLYPMPAVLVGTKVSEIPNFMTAAWCGIASHKPPAISVALQRKRYTLQGIKEQKTFSINVPSVDLVKFFMERWNQRHLFLNARLTLNAK